MTNILANELGPRGISVKVVSPGTTDTELFGHNKTEVQKHLIGKRARSGGWATRKTSLTPWQCSSATTLTGSPARTFGQMVERPEGEV